MRTHLYFLIALLYCFSINAHADIKPFTFDSLNEIENSYPDTPFLLILWSTDCPPCLKEFALLENLKKEYDQFNLVLINTDGLSEQTVAKKILLEFSLEHSDNWIFSESNLEKLRYHIDIDWAGELPRAYFYYPSQPRSVVSGLLTKEMLETWLAY